MIAVGYFLGLCASFVPGDIELSDSICRYTIEAKHRNITPYDLEPDGMYALSMALLTNYL